MERYLQIGKIVNTHGFRGDVKMQTWSDTPEDVTALKKLYRLNNGVYTVMKIKKCSVHKGMALIKFEGVDDFDSANILREEILYADRNDMKLDEGVFFIADLIGVDVVDIDTGRIYGKLKEVMQYGIHDIYTVETPRGEVLIPAVSEFVKKIVPEEGIFVKPIEGMFDEV